MDPLSIAGVIKAGVSLGSALKGGPSFNEQLDDQLKAQRKFNRLQLKYDRQNLKNIVRGAQAAGFNPLTVLQGGGGSTMGAAPPLTSPLSTSQRVAQAVGTAADDFMQIYEDPITKEARELNNELIQARIEQIQGENLRLGQGVPSLRTTTSPTEGSSPESDDEFGPLQKDDPNNYAPEENFMKKVYDGTAPAWLITLFNRNVNKPYWDNQIHGWKTIWNVVRKIPDLTKATPEQKKKAEQELDEFLQRNPGNTPQPLVITPKGF